MDVEGKVELIKGFANEIVTEDELTNLFQTKAHPVFYDGFEPSGIAPIHFGLLRATNLKSMLSTGVKFKLWLADYFGFINNKLGGDLELIQTAGKYFIEVWKACGIDTNKVELIWASEKMDSLKYWDRTLKIAKQVTLNRIKKSVTVLGRKEGDSLSFAQLMYPVMQVNDIFELELDGCQMGMDQRRANMLARDVAEKNKWQKPVAIHHPLLLGLKGVQNASGSKEEVAAASKMSKSDPSTCIYMHETEESLKGKINKAYCPEKIVDGNPILDYSKNIIFKNIKEMKIERPDKFGGDASYTNYIELERDFVKGDLHPMDLKLAVTRELHTLIEPVRKHFEKNKKAGQLYDAVKKAKITR
jgi:tyrosyl-tRNA synthetase